MDSGAALQEFLEFVLSQLVARRDLAGVSHEIDEQGAHVYRARVAEEDVGKVIGKNGRTASAIRSLLKAAGEKNDISVRLKIYQVGGEEDGKLVA